MTPATRDEDSSAVQAALDRLGRTVGAGMFLVAAVWFVVLPQQRAGAVWPMASAVTLSGAVGLWRAGGRASPWGPRLDLLLPPAVVVALAALQVTAGDVAWWQVIDTAAMGTLMASATMQPPRRSLPVAALTIAAAMLPAFLVAADSETAALTSYRLVQLGISYGIALLATEALRRAERRAEAARSVADHAQWQRLDEASDAGAHIAVRRVLHDTVLNTLEAIANGVPDHRWDEMRKRCVDDLESVAGIADVLPPREVSAFMDSMLGFGVAIETDVEWLSDPPVLVQEAVMAAAGEAIRNAAKHSGCPTVEFHARVEADSVFVEVIDAGVGFETVASEGLGLRTSIMASMDAVGGSAVISSAPGRGTRVSLTWDRGRARLTNMLSGMRRRLLRVLGVTAMVSLAAFAVSAVGDAGLTDLPARLGVIAIAGATVAVLVGSALADRGRRWAWPAGLIGLAVVTLDLPLTDPLCSSFQSAYPFDLRALLMITIGMTVVSRGELVTAVAVLTIASALANGVWLRLGSSCGWTYLMVSGVATTLGVGTYVFVRAMQDQRRRLAARAVEQDQQRSAQAQRTARARQAGQWSGREVVNAVGLLQDIRDGAPNSPALRRRARDDAQQVRQWLLLMGTVGAVPAALTALRTRWPLAPRLVIDGDPRTVDDIGPGADAVAARLDDWIPRVPGAEVVITLSRIDGLASVLVRSDHPGSCEDPDAWSDEDGWWLHVTWQVGPGHLP